MSSLILKVANWNANSILKKNLDVTNFLQKHNIDIMLVTETFLKTPIKFSIPSYTIYRIDRTEGQKGGVAIFIKNSIKHRLMKSLNLKVIEGIGINVETSSGKISFISAYHPGANKNMKAFANDVVTLTKLNSSYFICGDINARHRFWNCANSNEVGKVLFGKLQTELFSIHHPNTPAYIPSDPNRCQSTLDIILSNNCHLISTPMTDLASDHLPVIFEILNTKPTANPCKYLYDYNEANWPNFVNNINNSIDRTQMNIHNITNMQQIDDMIARFNHI